MEGRVNTAVFSLCCFLLIVSLLMAVHISPAAAGSSEKYVIGEPASLAARDAGGGHENAPEPSRVQLAHYEDSFSFQSLRKKMSVFMIIESEEWAIRLL